MLGRCLDWKVCRDEWFHLLRYSSPWVCCVSAHLGSRNTDCFCSGLCCWACLYSGEHYNTERWSPYRATDRHLPNICESLCPEVEAPAPGTGDLSIRHHCHFLLLGPETLILPETHLRPLRHEVMVSFTWKFFSRACESKQCLSNVNHHHIVESPAWKYMASSSFWTWMLILT